MKYLVFIIFSCLIYSNLRSQIESGMYSMSYVPQAVYFNPAFRPHTPFNVGFSVPIGISSPFSYNDLVVTNSDNTTTIDASRFYNNLRNNSYLSTDLSPDLTIGGRINNRWYLNLSMREIGQGGFRLPKELLDLFINGNAKDSSLPPISIGNLNIVANHYREIGLNASFIYNCKWQFGGRLKYLIGYQNAHTTQSNISLYTNPNNYQLSLQGQFIMKTSGTDDNSLNSFGSNPFKFTSNWGLGLDLGAIYKHNDKWTFGGSITDLGFIIWKEHNNIIQNNPNASFVFSGLDINAYNNSDNFIRTILDSIQRQFDLSNNVLNESYSTSLITKMYLNAEYHLNKMFDFGGTANLSIRYKAFFPILSAYAKINLANWIQMQANYNITPNSFTNIGLGTVFNLGPVQLFMVSDNILGLAFYPKSSKDLSIRAGLNVVWPFSKKKDYCDLEEDSETEKTQEEAHTEYIDTTYVDTLKNIIVISPPMEEPSNLIVDSLDKGKIDTIVKANKLNDVDRDGIKDSLDLCPLESGYPEFRGCPDRESMETILNKENSISYPGPTDKKQSKPKNTSPILNTLEDLYNIFINSNPSNIIIPGGSPQNSPISTPEKIFSPTTPSGRGK